METVLLRYEVRVERIRTSSAKSYVNTLQLFTARYRWVNMLWISVVGVAVTKGCNCRLSTPVLSVFCDSCSPLNLHRFVLTFGNFIVIPLKCIKKSLPCWHHEQDNNLRKVFTSEMWPNLDWGLRMFRSPTVKSGWRQQGSSALSDPLGEAE